MMTYFKVSLSTHNWDSALFLQSLAHRNRKAVRDIARTAFLLILSRPEYGLHLSPQSMENPMGQGVKRT
ncbi:hypothetical protein, partial [Aeromonas rivipollensis]|uniref:hypothetical protein n=1 Tax=Aeromonas rivipollensis TaxID=948519 RepID=UPI003D22AE12